MTDYDASKVHIEWAKKAAAWRNGDAKWTSSAVVASDEYIGFRLFEPVSVASPIGRSNSYLQHWRTNEYAIGFFQESYYLQTARLLYPAYGACSTTEATPNIHDISIRTSQTPLNMGRHLEIENETDAESERIDLMGLLPASYHTECTESQPKATQTMTWNVAKSLSVGTDDITEPSSLGIDVLDWSGISFPTFTYNSETLEADILGWSFDIQNNVFWRGLSGGLYSIGKIGDYLNVSVSLNIVPTGKNCKELIRTALESYVTDLDLTVKIARSATDYIQFTHDKLYCYPFDIIPPSRNKWFEGYIITMHQLNSGSLAIQAKDAYNNDYYENP